MHPMTEHLEIAIGAQDANPFVKSADSVKLTAIVMVGIVAGVAAVAYVVVGWLRRK